MVGGGPAARLVGDGRVIVQQRVKPDVGDIVRVKGQRDAPLQPRARAGHTEVIQGLLQEFQHLLLPVSRKNKVRVLPQIIHQPVLILPQFEKIVRLRDFRDRTKNLRPGTIRVAVLLLQELLLAGAVETLVFGLVDFPLVKELLEHLGDDPPVTGFGRADEIVIGDVELGEQRAELRANLIDILLRWDAPLLRTLLHFLAVLINPGQEMHPVAHQAAEAGNDVRQHYFIGVAQVRRTVHVVDRGGDVERVHVVGWQGKGPAPKCRKFC
jgi:hypothetical protein